MPKLILSVDEKILEEYSIDKDTITIGRRVDNDVCLDNLAISGYHSQITIISNDCLLEDLNSTNGTFVNSKIIKKHALKDGDIIDIGNHRIKYINHLASDSANSNFEKTHVLSPEASQDRIDASIADLVDQIDAIAEADYVVNSKSHEELEDLENDLISEDQEDYGKSLETLANGETLDEVEESEPYETIDDLETMDSITDFENKNPEVRKVIENVNPVETIASENNDLGDSDSTNSVETAINTGSHGHESVYDPAGTMDNIEEPVIHKALDPIETIGGLEIPDQVETLNFDATVEKERSAAASDVNNDLGKIQILNGSNAGKELVLDKSLTTVGKPGVAVVGITRRNSGYFITQTEGNEENTAKLNSENIVGKAKQLENHDIIDVAEIKLEFYTD